jgi:hypothetical protein
MRRSSASNSGIVALTFLSIGSIESFITTWMGPTRSLNSQQVKNEGRKYPWGGEVVYLAVMTADRASTETETSLALRMEERPES